MAASNTPTPELVVGEPCPCCGAKYRGPKQSEEDKKAKRQAYNKKRAAELKELRELKAKIDAEQATDQ